MQGGEKLSLEQIRALMDASQEVRFEGSSREEVYGWMGRMLSGHGYHGQKQATYQRHRFAGQYTRADIELLARVDEAHESLKRPGDPGAPVHQTAGWAVYSDISKL